MAADIPQDAEDKALTPDMRQEVREIIQMVLAENYRKLDYRESVKGSPPLHLDRGDRIK